MPTSDHARFDARLPKAQKEFFEKAASLGGFRSLTDFIILTAQEKAIEIIKEKEQDFKSSHFCSFRFQTFESCWV